MVPSAPSRMVWKVLHCSSKRGISSLCSSRDLSAWLRRGCVCTVLYFDEVSRACSFVMSLGFIARGYGFAAPSACLSRATLLERSCTIGRPSLVRVCWVLFGT
jgi:hypothetical protein